jgi:hypothetical protein
MGGAGWEGLDGKGLDGKGWWEGVMGGQNLMKGLDGKKIDLLKVIL